MTHSKDGEKEENVVIRPRTFPAKSDAFNQRTTDEWSWGRLKQCEAYGGCKVYTVQSHLTPSRPCCVAFNDSVHVRSPPVTAVIHCNRDTTSSFLVSFLLLLVSNVYINQFVIIINYDTN